MYGWRARVGFIAPSRGDTFNYEFYKIVPEGVVLIMSGMTFHRLSPENFKLANENMEKFALDLAKVGVDYMYLGGSPLYTHIGIGSDKAAIAHIEKLTGIPCTTSITAEVDSMRACNIKKVVVVTPHTDAVNAKLKEFLTASGFEVVNMKGMQISVNTEISRVTEAQVYKFAKETFMETPGADGMFIHCPRWPTIYNISRLEGDFKVPIVTTTTAYIYATFDRLKIGGPIYGYGKLLELL